MSLKRNILRLLGKKPKSPYGLRYPREHAEFDDIPLVVAKYLADGYKPEKPFLGGDDLIVTMGSCFAINVGKSLAAQGLPVVINRLHEEANSPLANAMLLDYLQKGGESVYAKSFAEHLPVEKIDQIFSPLKKARCIVFTAGVGICCFRKSDGSLILRPNGVPVEEIEWRFPGVEENVAHLEAIVGVLKTVNPGAAIVITVSPVPLYRAITTRSPFVEDCVSKSLLRAAVHEFMQKGADNCYYWPSFEAFRWVGAHTGPVYGTDDGLPRHVSKFMVDAVIEAFVEGFVIPAGSKRPGREEELIHNVIIEDG